MTWTHAAIADFILNNGIGFTVDSLKEIPSKLRSISDADYRYMLENAARIQSKIIGGYFTNRALEQAERMLSHE